MKRVAIFQYERPLQIHTLNLAEAIASTGCHVDLFLKGCSHDFIDSGHLQRHPGVEVIDFDVITARQPARILWRGLYGILNRSCKRISYLPIILPVVLASCCYLRKEKYDIFVGAEKMGMIWASILSKLTGTPFVYYSLELYDEKHPFFAGVAGFSVLRRLEKKSHKKAAATIIQDDLRRDYLFRANGIAIGNRTIFLPVSVTKSPKESKSRVATRWPTSKVPSVLYIGWIDKKRYCLELAHVARHHATQFRVIFHGWGDPIFLKDLEDIGGGAVVLSTEMVSEDRLSEVAGSGDIGLAIYGTEHANDRLTAFSSEKIALYCQAGVPFISFDTPSYRQLAEDLRCCVLIEHIKQLPRAVETIMSDYSTYSENAFLAFRKYYDFEKSIGPVIEQLDDISRGRGL